MNEPLHMRYRQVAAPHHKLMTVRVTTQERSRVNEWARLEQLSQNQLMRRRLLRDFDRHADGSGI